MKTVYTICSVATYKKSEGEELCPVAVVEAKDKDTAIDKFIKSAFFNVEIIEFTKIVDPIYSNNIRYYVKVKNTKTNKIVDYIYTIIVNNFIN